MIKGAVQQEHITLVNIYAPNTGASEYVKQILMDRKGQAATNIVVVRHFNTPLMSVDRSSRQRMNKKLVALNDTVDQMDLIYIFRAFHPKKQNIHSFVNSVFHRTRIFQKFI